MTVSAGKQSGEAHPRRWFSALTGRILALNIIALALLVGAILYLDRFRTGLIDTRLAALSTQAELIAGAVGEAAPAGPDLPAIDLLLARQIIGRLAETTHVRARLFANDGTLLVDSRAMHAGNQVTVASLPGPGFWSGIATHTEQLYEKLVRFLARDSALPLYRENDQQRGTDYREVIKALAGIPATAVRTTDSGTLLLSAAIPVQRFRRVLGSLMATVETSEIQELVRQERLAILEISGLALIVTAFLSLYLARTIARPVHRLAEAADKVRRGHGRRTQIPDFSRRRDEIGDLSSALRDMTAALYRRMDAIEGFAADVAHELRNPLSSLRSAVETMERAKREESRRELMNIIKEDVIRIDRLITDISDASRLDAELSRAEADQIDLSALLRALCAIHDNPDTNGPETDGRPEILLDLPVDDSLTISGMEGRLGQVLRNLIDNAISFSPPSVGGRAAKITVSARREKECAVIEIKDEGPGIPEHNLEDIFGRFYSERPEGEAFGTHSGLGLSISKQIIEAHGGRIRARNRDSTGACFTIELPA